MQTNEIILRPAMIFAFLKAVPLMLFATLFLLLAWLLSPFFFFQLRSYRHGLVPLLIHPELPVHHYAGSRTNQPRHIF